ncbi:MAG: thioredoxin domain-containing protein, partial [Deltaproteobacteria bacterium]|nr:thioredoxin domain-containing protein [Deltaproteobacteria bacterium]
MSRPDKPNRLAQEASPYLQQHQYNPVDWYPWGPEALEKAKQEDKPIFLSIGYSTCHWCHVMAHESFENEKIAAIMNEHFVNIKVDREERPDLDETYMNAVTLMTGRGGWPMSVFLTPDLKPFYGGTYFPPEDRPGLPGFPRLLLALAKAYRENRAPLLDMGAKVEDRLKIMAEMPGPAREPDLTLIQTAAENLRKDFDPVNGGFGRAPKFPRALELAFMLHCSHFLKDPLAWEIFDFSLEKMARGGLYDQVGGGFHRYTVDEKWVVPHFEKMLYDNALLVPLYLAHYQLTGSSLSRRVARETLDFALRELEAPAGGFYSAWDADSEGVEGKFYVWSQEEFDRVVGPELAPLAVAALGVTPEGNFDGKNVLTRPFPQKELARRFSLSEDQVRLRLRIILERLFLARRKRIRPHRDEKIIVSWNGLMLTALCYGTQVLGDRIYYEAAERGARFIFEQLFKEDRLYRVWSGGRISVPGFLDDYASLAHALLDLFETDFNPEWLAAACHLAGLMERWFLDESDGSFFYVASDQDAALVRTKSAYDQMTPSGNSLAARVFWRLHRFTGQARYLDRFQAVVHRFMGTALESPWGFSHLLTVALLHLSPPLDLTLVGPCDHPGMQGLLAEIYRRFLPERRLVVKDPTDCARLEELVPPTKTYAPQGDAPVAYLCYNFTCQPPVS